MPHYIEHAMFTLFLYLYQFVFMFTFHFFVNTTTDDCKKYNMAYIMQFYDDLMKFTDTKIHCMNHIKHCHNLRWTMP